MREKMSGDGRLRDRRQYWVGALLVVLTFAAFWPVLGNGFVNLDDPSYVTKNPYIRSGVTLQAVKWALTTGHNSNWHPLTWISHMIDRRLFGLDPTGHHAVNLLLHMANVILLFAVLRRMTGSLWKSAFVAALFGVHPLHVESVAWISERKDVLSTFFWLLTMWAYARYVQRPSVLRYLWVFGALALGLTAKPMLVTLPFVLLLLDYWPLERFAKRRDKNAGERWSGWKLILEKAPLIALAMTSSVITYIVQQKGGAVSTLGLIPPGMRVSNAVVAYVTYIGKTVWPRDLAVFYPHPGDSLRLWQILGAAVVLACITLAVFRAAQRRRYLAVGWLWYLGTLVPVIGLVQVGAHAVADRYTYIPLVGLFMIAAWGIPELAEKGRKEERKKGGKGERKKSAAFTLPYSHTPILAALAAVVVAVLAAGTWVQVGYWHDSVSLFTRAIEVTEGNYVAHYNLGVALADQGKMKEAAAHYAEALRISPDFTGALSGMGNALIRAGKTEEAIARYAEALRLKPDDPSAHYNLGVALAQQGKADEAIEHYSEAVRLKPEMVEAHCNLGVLLDDKGRSDEAIEHLTKALQLDPEFAQAHYNLALVLGKKGDINGAIQHLTEAVRIRPNYAEAHNNLGSALASQGRIDEAAVHFAKAVRARPGFAEAHFNLGLAFKTRGKMREAIDEFKEAIRLEPRLVPVHYHLALALYAVGDFAGAWEEVRRYQEYGGKPDPRFWQALAQKAGGSE